MDNTTYTMNVIVNFVNETRSWTIEDAHMSQGALEDAIIAVLDGNYDATSFVLTIVRKKD